MGLSLGLALNAAPITLALGRGGGALPGMFGETLPLYEGLVGTNGRIPYFFNTTNKQKMSRTWHVHRGPRGTIKPLFPNWYWAAITTRLETNAGATATIEASIEKMDGSITRLTFGGSNTGTLTNGGGAYADYGGDLEDGEGYWLRSWTSSSAGIPYNGVIGPFLSPRNDGRGECMAFGVTTPNRVMEAGSFTSTDGGSIYHPQFIVGMTTRPSFLLDGDSKCYGTGDTVDASNDLGELARTVGQYCGYANVGSYGDGFAGPNTTGNYNKRAYALPFTTNVVSQRGINALRAGGENKSFATVQTEAQTFWAKFSAKRLTACTISPVSASSDGWTSVAGQTPNANAAAVAAFNDYVRTKPSPLAGYHELADLIESGRNSGRWKADGATAGLYTADGLHGSQFANLAIKSSGAIQ